MRWTVLAAALAAAAAAAARASDVVQINKGNFEAIVGAEPALLVEFFAPWCGHCKALAPKFEDAATKLKGTAKIAQVDCTVENDLCTQQGVKGYPTLKVFRGTTSNPTEYSGAREADAIVSFMRKQVSPAITAVEEGNVATFADTDKVVVLLYVKAASGPEFEAFSALAKNLRDSYTFGYVVDADGSTAAAEGASTPGVVLYKKFDDRKTVYGGDVNAEDLTEFIKGNSVPLMDDIGPDNYQSYAESGLPLAYLFVGSDADRAAYGPGVEKIAREFKGRVNFVYLDASKYGGHANNVNLKQEWPAFAIQRQTDGAKFPYDQTKTISEEAIRAFVTSVVAGAVEPSLKSEDVPASQDAPVFVLVGKQFAEIVNQPKDVFVEFYAPWCGHCKNLAPIWDELAGKMPSGIVIAKMDSTANDVPSSFGIQIQGFPTLKLFRADNRVVDYEGDRSLADLLKFVKKHASNGSKVKATVGDDDDEDDEKDEL